MAIGLCIAVAGPTDLARATMPKHATTLSVTSSDLSLGSVGGNVSSSNAKCRSRRLVRVYDDPGGSLNGSTRTKRSGLWLVFGAFDDPIVIVAFSRKVFRDASGVTHVCRAETIGPLDLSPPALAISAPAEGSTTASQGSIVFSPGDSDTVACTLDGPSVPCDLSGSVFYALGEDTHTFSVTGTDTSGNTGHASVRWFVDATGPILIITQPTDGSSTAKDGSFTFVCDAARSDATSSGSGQ